MKIGDIKIAKKLWFSYSFLALIIGIVGGIGFYKINSMSTSISNISDNRIPDLIDFAQMNTERMVIRSQTLEVWVYEAEIDARSSYENILSKRQKSWEKVEKTWSNILNRTRQSETGRKLIEQLKEEYKAWRDVYINIDKTIANLSRTIDPKEKQELYVKYHELYTAMVPVSDKMGVTFTEALNNNRDNTTKMIGEDKTSAERSGVVIGFIIFISIAIAIIASYVIVNAITKPLQKSVTFAESIAGGDLTIKLDINQKDEIGMLAASLQKMIDKLREVIGSILAGSQNIAEASMQMSSTSQNLSQGANEQASSVEQVSSTMEEITSNIEQNNENSSMTEKISTQSLAGMLEMSKKSGQAVEANRTIADKIKIINDIAFQTNILALNAAVEAARAGEQGRGFAVVASEVRKLAERSKLAADEIVSISDKGLKLSEEAGQKMHEIMPDLERTTKMVQEIAAASAEQTNGASQINNAIQQLNTVTQQNAAASEELSSSAEELSSQAELLKDLVSYFNIEEKSKHKFASAKKIIKQNPLKDEVVDRKKGLVKGYEFHLNESDDSAFKPY